MGSDKMILCTLTKCKKSIKLQTKLEVVYSNRRTFSVLSLPVLFLATPNTVQKSSLLSFARMESGAFEEDLTCSVCLHVYQDPVILPCQHSFCLQCINSAWKHVTNRGGVSCPECRRTFKPRPQLQKNFTLRNIVEKYNQSQVTAAESIPVMCEYCIENPSPAVKTCLKCETSFCSLHLKPHLTKKTYQDHILIEPLVDLTKKQCMDHKKILEFYCEQDQQCVCISCTVIGQHKSHNLLSLDQAEASVKDKLKKECQDLHGIQKNVSIDQEDLKKAESEIKTRSNELKEKLLNKFTEWRKQLEEDEKYALKLINDEENRVLSEIGSKSKSLEQKMEQIKLIDTETEKQMKMDCLSFLQESKQLFTRISQIQGDMGAVDDDKVPLRQKTSSNFGLPTLQHQRRGQRNLSRQYQYCGSVPVNSYGIQSMSKNAQYQQASRPADPQTFTLELSNAYQSILQRMNQHKMYERAVLEIINGEA
ncbi:E3 ubiquitin/ISG15 ligase TRIM25-like isoform X2 [Stegostoma tigrinum]|uniref:E3 ubiquitin/ISG15 ligase TRIM25-like isoform X2 n=1 Tax=Stegostoma tigrinum TaxID=3053191 RepID=UPI00202B6AAF|nr:E3 ubiquitin/ISG15 ligase TRIM25-like isoform X2 [Stegostoma tigrinum]